MEKLKKTPTCNHWKRIGTYLNKGNRLKGMTAEKTSSEKKKKGGKPENPNPSQMRKSRGQYSLLKADLGIKFKQPTREGKGTNQQLCLQRRVLPDSWALDHEIGEERGPSQRAHKEGISKKRKKKKTQTANTLKKWAE